MNKQKATKNTLPDATLKSEGASKKPPALQLTENPQAASGGSFATETARIMALLANTSDTELLMQELNQYRMQLANVTSSLFNQSANLAPDSSAAQAIQARIAHIQQVDKMLEMQVNRLNTQHQAVQTELEAVRRVISTNIKESFSLME